MIFMTYWFAAFAVAFFPIYWIARNTLARRLVLLAGCAVFHFHFAGPAGVMPIIVLAIATYLAGLARRPFVIYGAITLNASALVFYKYALFLGGALIGLISADAGHKAIAYLGETLLPAAPPLAISFFVFEFVHYLVDVRRGTPSIRSPLEFSLFAIFWPSIVAGPIKRYEQFLPALGKASVARIERSDLIAGLARLAIGIMKKTVADNLTLMTAIYADRYAAMTLPSRWLFVLGLAFRILLDFSGYSDLAIGFARLMGVRLLENFNWPYLATSLNEFWRRWHISLSSWIRDYIYIPLGGGRRSPIRRVGNALLAFGLCGLWHGAGWNFALWGLYHGVGVSVGVVAGNALDRLELPPAVKPARMLLGWTTTMLFVLIGWLIFFYPVGRAVTMAGLLFKDP
jgi:alginate O-acetyltransferase complex protein AlgI